jgi:amino acid transporter
MGDRGSRVGESITRTSTIRSPPNDDALWRTVTWRASLLVPLGAALLITVSLGPMAAELGRASWLVWLATALIGALQCLLLAELAARRPSRAGGTATYAHAAIGERFPILGAVSSWGYWFAWTPGIAVNLILAATYLHETVWSGLSTLAFALVAGAVLYALNALGLRTSLRAAALAAGVAVVPLLVIVGGALADPSLLDFGRTTPLSVPHRSWGVGSTWLLIAKWLFVAAWAAYGAEMASTVVAEMHDGARKAPRAMKVAATMGVFAFGVLPFLMVALVGVGRLTKDPLVAFLPVAQAVFGHGGRTVLGVMLAAALVLGAQAFIVGSSRTIYQMTRDGYLPRQFARLNGRGIPVGSIACDGVVILALLLIFGENVVEVVASANVGYLIVFVLMPVAYVALRRREGRDGKYRLGRAAVPLAAFLSLFNAVLLVVGGLQWGAKIMLTGVIVMVAIVPIMLTRRLQDRRAGRTRLLRFPAGEPHDLSEDKAVPDAAPALQEIPAS